MSVINKDATRWLKQAGDDMRTATTCGRVILMLNPKSQRSTIEPRQSWHWSMPGP